MKHNCLFCRTFGEGNPSYPFRVEKGCDLGEHLYITEPFAGFSVVTPTWCTYSGNYVSLAVYSWKGSYDNTVSESPLYSKRFQCGDNVYTTLEFGEGSILPTGDYFFRIYDTEGIVGIHVYGSNDVSRGYIFQDGNESAGELRMVVLLKNETHTPFRPVEKTQFYTSGHTAPEEYKIQEDSLINTHEVMPDTWVFTDELGRRSLTNKEVGDPKPDKTLALFYWTWHTSREINVRPTNNQKLMEEHPEIKNDFENKLWDEAGSWNWWNEPVWGYYVTTDEWVLRKQAELLADAGVDAVFTDNTNGVDEWRESYTKLYETWDRAMSDGVKTPKISFMFPFWHTPEAKKQMKDIYRDIYLKGKYHNLWYYLDGKPMLMGHPDSMDPEDPIEKDIREYFTFRKNIPEYDDNDYKTSFGCWGWLSMYPQAYYYANEEDAENGKTEQTTVGVSQNHDYVTHRLSAMNGENIAGRSYTKDLSHINEPDSKLHGYNFAEQFEYALGIDPKVLFVTGWNEWIANRKKEWMSVANAFPDQFSDEFSRDIEPTRGELRDNYYYQFVNFVRRYKGARPIPQVGPEKTIDLNAGPEQWKDVEPYYAAYMGNTGHRHHKSPGNVIAGDYSGRNGLCGFDSACIYYN